MRPTPLILLCSLATVALACDNSPPPPRVPVPAQGTLGPPRHDPAKPLPGQVPPQQYAPQPAPQPPPVRVETGPQGTNVQITPAPVAQAPASGATGGFDPRIAAPPADQVYLPPPPAPGSFDDQPIIRDRPPETRAFVDAYNRVGRPRIALYVNRKLDGDLIAPAPLDASTNVRVDRNARVDWDPWRGGTVNDRIDVSVPRPSAWDEATARALDYEALETILTDWLSANGQTEIISPTLARARLTQEQRDALEKGERFVLTDITQRLDADIFIQVQARPTRQSARGLDVRIVAEALNTRGGRSIARAVVDVPPPLTKPTLNEYTRFLARKLMDDMIITWSAPTPQPAPQPAPQPSAPPSTQPSR